MNHLGHLYLARSEGQLMAGAFLGDFVKGTLKGDHPPNIETGIKFHRAVDAFVDSHPIQRQSINRFDPRFRRYGGIICDVVYDHFLARHWATFHDQDFLSFCRDAYQWILDEHHSLGESATMTITRMQEYGSLESYPTQKYVYRTLERIGERLKRTNPLDIAFEEFVTNKQALEADFLAFMPSINAFAIEWLRVNAEPQKS
tara:strand:+ start:10493 stop:11095 length:603 start_codon:yes stop_codon:yes gene_type:complete